MGSVRKHSDIKLVIAERRGNQILQSFLQNIISNGNEKHRDTYEQTCPCRTFNTRIK